MCVIDKEVVETKAETVHLISSAIYVDSNCASYLRSFAYEAQPSERVRQVCESISENITQGFINEINTALYLYEITNNLADSDIVKVRQTISAIKSIAMINSKFDFSWRDNFIHNHRLRSEAEADNFLFGYFNNDEYQFGKLLQVADIMELLLLKTKIIECSSNRSAENKLIELINFIDEEIAIVMPKEIAVCVDIIFRKNELSITKKLNDIKNKSEPLKLIRNCAMDLFIVRMLDLLTNTISDNNETQFHLAQILTCDKDIWDIIELTGLSAIAVHRLSNKMLPIYNEKFSEWIFDTLGDKKMDSISKIFTPQGIVGRDKRFSIGNLKECLYKTRKEFSYMLNSGRDK
ncbi:hypothetical protein [Pantoea sp.]|uniref:hypothetical protein n=1 Tax=Pantoea sp. TaxID=69393 RepID=UPI0031D50318